MSRKWPENGYREQPYWPKWLFVTPMAKLSRLQALAPFFQPFLSYQIKIKKILCEEVVFVCSYKIQASYHASKLHGCRCH